MKALPSLRVTSTFFLLFVSSFVLGSNSTTEPKAPLSAHVHGVVGLDIAVDKKEILIMLKSPSESFLGFEYYPKTDKEKKLVQHVRNTWLNEFSRLFSMKNLSKCKVKEKKWEHYFESKSATHSEVRAQAYLACEEKLMGKDFTILLKNLYPRIEKIHLQFINSKGKAHNINIKKSSYKIKL